MDADEKRVVCHPRDEAKADAHALMFGLNVQVSDHCPPGTIFVLDPSRLFGGPDGDDEGWQRSVGRIDNVA